MSGAQSLSDTAVNQEEIFQWIEDLLDWDRREAALLELSKKRELVPDLAVWLWRSFGTVAALLQEVIAIYPDIDPPTLTATQANRVCNALALMQCIASHRETRGPFLAGHIPLLFIPFLHTTKASRPFEYLRLTSLGVIGALVKTDDKEVIPFLLSTEIIPLCLRIMEHGSELSKTVATFIIQKILLDDMGLHYICLTYERFAQIAMIMGKMVLKLSREPSARLLKHIVRCYARLSENPRAEEALRQCLPDHLKDETFKNQLDQDRSTRYWLRQLHSKLGIDNAAAAIESAMEPAERPKNYDVVEVRCMHLMVKHEGSRRPSSWRSEKITRSKEDARNILNGYAKEINEQSSLAEKRAKFKTLAKEFSDCSSAAKGGDLGYFNRTTMQPAFTKTSFALDVDQMSDICDTDSGLHLIWRLG